MTESTEVRSYADVVASHAPALLRLAVMLTGSTQDAEDLLQTTFVRAAPHADRIATMGAPASYLRTILLNELLTAGRRRSRQVRTVATDTTPEPSNPGHADAVDHRDETWRWLSTVTGQQRAVLALRYYEDLPDSEIAVLLDCSESTVRSHARRGLASLRTHLTDGGSPA